MKPVDRVGGRVAYRESGVGPPVLFLHGLGGSRYAWEPQLESLGATHRCLAWDMPGYGDSEPLSAPLTFTVLADAVARFLDELEIERADLVGLSFGGQQALHVGLRHPDRLRRLVLADTSARFGADGTDADEWKRLRLGPLDAGLTPADMAAGVVDAITAPGFGGRERDRTIAAFGRIPAAGLRAAVECLPTHDVETRLCEISRPTLVIVGELDTETPRRYADVLVDAIVGARLCVIPEAGHLTPAEAPERFNHVVGDFLR